MSPIRCFGIVQAETYVCRDRSVGEEGLDFPACDLVIRFDPLQTMIGYVQSRGRARHQKSKFILMLNQDQPVEIQNYEVSHSWLP